MKRVKRGFTIVEVSLFIAITGLVFVGIAIGTQNSIFQQRYNDAVQNFAEFLRSIYSQVTNVQSEGAGRTNYAIYGKLVIFGSEGEGEAKKNKITSYNVIGSIESEGDAAESSSILGQLEGRNANILYKDSSTDVDAAPRPVGIVEEYTLKWDSVIQTTTGWENNSYKIFEGALLIVRSPDTGSVNTYTYIGDGDEMYRQILSSTNPLLNGTGESHLTNGDFKKADMNFCLNPNGNDKSSLRKNIKITSGARNSSGIIVVPDYDSECQQ